jgi:hypothetical protein
VYDMYPWNRPARASNSTAAAPSPETTEGARAAVQVALDRRDNGGDAAAAANGDTAVAANGDAAAAANGDTAAAAHRPAAGPTRQ